MLPFRELIEKHRAAIFDWLVIMISFTLSFIFPTLEDFIRTPGFSNWFLVSLLLYIIGASLKDLPMSQRLSFLPAKVEIVPYVLFLLIGHWFIIFFWVVLGEAAFRSLFHLPPLTDENAASWQVMTTASVVATLMTWLVYRTKSNRKKRSAFSSTSLFRMELIADIMLILAVSIFSFVVWEKGAMAMLDRAPTKTFGDIWFLFVFLAILFLFFYLPLRYLYFMEDRKGSANRKRLLYIFMFLLLKGLVEILKN